MTWLEALWLSTVTLFEVWGVPMLVGSAPWALGGAFLGYRWSLRFVTRARERRLRKRLAAARLERRRRNAAETEPKGADAS